MTTITLTRAVVEQALEALAGVAQWVETRPFTHPWDAWQKVAPAMDVLRAALDAPQEKQEPVAWMYTRDEGEGDDQVISPTRWAHAYNSKRWQEVPLYTHPPQDTALREEVKAAEAQTLRAIDQMKVMEAEVTELRERLDGAKAGMLKMMRERQSLELLQLQHGTLREAAQAVVQMWLMKTVDGGHQGKFTGAMLRLRAVLEAK